MMRLDRGQPGIGALRMAVRPPREEGSPGQASIDPTTERGRTGDDRTEPERLTGAVLDSVTAHIAVLDEYGTILAVNRSWREFARANGADPAAVAEGANYLQVCEKAAAEGAEGAAAFAAGIREVLAGRTETFEVEYPCHAPDRRRWFVARLTRLRCDGPPRVVVSHEDITGRKLAEAARAESEAILHNFFDHAPALLGVVEIEGDDIRFILSNASSAGYLGLEPPAMAGRRASELGVPRRLVELWIEKFFESRRTGQPARFPYVEDFRVGSRRMSGIACYLGPSPEGRQRFAYVAEDITERRLAEETIAEQIRIDEYGRDLRLALIRDVPMRPMMTRCAEAMVEHLGVESAWIWTLDEAGEILELQGRAGPQPQGDGPPIRVPLGQDVIGRIAERRQPYLIDDPPGDLRLGDLAWAACEGPAAFAGYPLLVEEKLVGVAAIVARRPLSDSKARAMLSMANGIALGIERRRAEDRVHRLNEQLRRRLQQTRALRRIDSAITTSRDLGRNLALVAEETIVQLGVDAAAILVREEEWGTLNLAAARGLPTADLAQDLGDPLGLAHRVVQIGRPLCIPDLTDAPVADPRVGRLVAGGIAAYHAIPLMADGRVKGLLECFLRAPMEPDAEWFTFAGALAEQAAIAVDNAALFEGLRRSNEELRAAYDSTIEGWARALDLRDHETEGHSRRVTEMTLALAGAMGLDEAELVHVRRGALLHDIGKLGVPDAILRKGSSLDGAEWAVMRRHPGYAVEILGPIEFLRPALDIPHYHHERWDGTGYPRGLAGERIPLPARLFAAVDIWDALSHDRPYRKAWPQARVREHLRSLAGTHLDPRVVATFLRLLARDDPAPSGV